MHALAGEARRFSKRLETSAADAAQRAALQILCGISLDDALDTSSKTREAIVQRIERALKSERMKGLRRHWSYDLNRHIALKQALDRLRPGPQQV